METANIKKELIKAGLNLGLEATNLNFDYAIETLLDVFKNEDLKEKTFINAIKKGSSGKYGVYHKITVNIIGYWVWSYLAETRKGRVQV